MHEFALCEELVSAVLTEMAAIAPPARLKMVRVVVGGLRQVVPDNLTFAYGVLTAGTPAANSALEIESRPVVGECTECGWRGEITESVFQCGACGSFRMRVLGGMELYLDTLEIERDDTAGD